MKGSNEPASAASYKRKKTVQVRAEVQENLPLQESFFLFFSNNGSKEIHLCLIKCSFCPICTLDLIMNTVVLEPAKYFTSFADILRNARMFNSQDNNTQSNH